MTHTPSPSQRATTLQLDASNPEHSAWVSASAGSGKTKVLVQRILRLLLNDTRPETILAVTYTTTAAAEMKNRITDDLQEWAVCDEDRLIHILDKVLGHTPTQKNIQTARKIFASVLDTPGGIKIQTLHSFCQSILAKFPLESGVPVRFSIAENTKYLEQQAFEQIIKDPAHLSDLQHIMRYDFEDIKKEILSHKYAIENIYTKGVEHQIDKTFKTLGIKQTDILGVYKQRLVDGFTENINLCRDFLQVIQSDTGKTTERFKHAINTFLDTPPTYATIDTLLNDILVEKQIRISNGGAGILKNNQSILAPLLDVYKAYIDHSICLEVAQNTASALRVFKVYMQAYKDIKRQHNVLDFDDIIMYTKRLFENVRFRDWVAYKIDRGHQHILLDESQDISPIQWDILRQIITPMFENENQQTKDYPERTIFAVGDEKQSIYGFQGADPAGFVENKNVLSKMATQNTYAFQDIQLDVSFRTTPAVLSWVDATMKCAGMKNMSDDTDITHIPNRATDIGRVELLPVLYQKNNTTLKTDVMYALEIAYKVFNILDKKPYLPSKKRHATAGDILVLVPKRTGRFVNTLTRNLQKFQIAVSGLDRLKLYDDIAVKDIMAVLQFMILPNDDLTLACILKSPLVGFTDEQIFDFAHNRGTKSLWSALRAYGKYANVANYLQSFLTSADFIRPFESINTLLNNPCQLQSGRGHPLTGRQAFVARLGAYVHDVLDEMLNLAISFERENPPTIQGFLDMLCGDDITIKRDTDSVSNTEVRIMTVHGAKGLESPIVILPQCYHKTEDKDKLYWSEDKDIFLLSVHKEHQPIVQKALDIEGDSLEKQQAESKRLLYVAMTRAEDILICGGYGKKHSSWCWYDALYQGIQDLPNHQSADYIPFYDKWDITSVDVSKQPYGKMQFTYTNSVPENVTPPTITQDVSMGTAKDKLKFVLPPWVGENADVESPMVRPLSPSRIFENNDVPALSPLYISKGKQDIYQRGNIMHNALEHIGNVDPENQRQALYAYLQTPSFTLSPSTQDEYAQEILQVIESHPFLFSHLTRAEVPISGIVNVNGTQHPYNGIIDRLCVLPDMVWVVDFKSNRPPSKDVESVPAQYKQQIQIYGDLVAQIYPEKTIRTALLWTYSCTLLEIPR